MDMADLEPDVLFRQWARGVANDIFETLNKSAQERDGMVTSCTYL